MPLRWRCGELPFSINLPSTTGNRDTVVALLISLLFNQASHRHRGANLT